MAAASLTEPADPFIGRTVAGRYEVLSLIGKGGMGAIYEVRHLKLGRTFALKRLSDAYATDPTMLARFRREADIVARLRHPNVVEIVDWDTLDDGSPCLVMERLHGQDLAARLATEGPLPWPTIARIADAVLAALEVAHQAGIVHRDLKPKNIFLARDDAGGEHVKLLDFGLSKVRDQHSVGNEANLIGTPLYMAPEQANGKPAEIGPAVDVWAVGAILHELATGHPAFDAPTAPVILYRICYGQPEPLLQHRPDAPPAVVEVIEAALSRDPSKRIVDAAELRRRLRAALDLAPLTPPRRNSWLWPAAAVAAAGLALAAYTLRPSPPSVAIPLLANVPPPPPPAPPPLTLHVVLHPPQARVSLDGVPQADSTITIPRDGRSHHLLAAAIGFHDATREVDSTSPTRIELNLKPVEKPATRAEIPRPPTLDP